MKRAYRTTWNGIVSIVAAESRTRARYAMYWDAVNAGYCLSLLDIAVVRAPEYDGWAAVDKTGHCWAEENVPKGSVNSMTMSAAQMVMREIILNAIDGDPDDFGNIATDRDEIGEKTVEELYRDFTEIDGCSEYENEFRCSGVETGLPCDYSRHYESKSVAAQLRDGTWVGWTYWYGGGKHGEPESVEWIDDAYFLDVTEMEKTAIVREFKKR